MTTEIITSYLISIAVTAIAVKIWRKFSHNIIEDIIFAVAVWLSTISFLGFIGRFS